MSVYARVRWSFRTNPLLRRAGYRLLGSGLVRPLNELRINWVRKRYRNFPRIVSLESTNRCNSNCVMCAHQSLGRSKGFMADGLFRAAIDECARYPVERVYLSGFGEPLLDPALADKVAYAAARGVPTGIVTNGSLLDEKKTRDLVRAGIGEITVSLDGFSPAVYNRIRRGLDFDRVRENIRRLVGLRTGRAPQVNLAVVVLEENRQDIERGYREWRGSVDRLILRSPQDWLGALPSAGNPSTPHSRHAHRPPCHYPFTELSVYQDGTVPLCCLDYDGMMSLGTFPGRSIREIWTGEPLATLRALHLAGGQRRIPACRSCSYYSVWW